jgi:hypothetical protein
MGPMGGAGVELLDELQLALPTSARDLDQVQAALAK